jgi:fatty acid desaturase
MSLTQFSDAEKEAIANRKTALRFLFFPAQVLSMYFTAFPWPVDHWAVQVFWMMVTAYFMFCWTSCFHETAHQTLFSSQRLSVALGRVLGWLMFVPYTAYRETHIRHHAYLNKPNDWELWPYSDPKAPRWFRKIFVWCDLLLGVATAPIVYGRIFFHSDSPLKPEARKAIRWEYAGMILFWGLVLGVVAYYDRWWTFALVWFIPYSVAGIYQNGRKLTEHLGMRSYDPLRGTRTVIGDNFVTRLCTFLNFDIFVHGPHHRHPRVSHDQLEELTLKYVAQQETAANPLPLFPTYFSATRDMLYWFFKEPGVGVNVGAEWPGQTDQVEDFVADVTEEVVNTAQPSHA